LTALGPALEPIRLNYCRFFLLFSLDGAVVDRIEEGEEIVENLCVNGNGGRSSPSTSQRGRSEGSAPEPPTSPVSPALIVAGPTTALPSPRNGCWPRARRLVPDQN
jgi:hypothetical protein